MNSLTYQLFHIFSGAWRRRYAIVVPILVLPVMGALVGIVSPKHYASHTSMLIQETAKMNPFLEDLAVSAMLKERMDALQTLLHSRHILGAVAEKRGLVDEDTPADEYDVSIEELSSALSVQMVGKDLIRIDYKSNSPEEMKETLEVVRQQFIEQLLAPERSSMKDSSYFLAEHLKNRRKELDKAEAALAEFKDQHANELPELHLTNISRLAGLKQRLSEREAELAGASKSLGSLDQQLSKTNPVVGRIEEQIVRIRGELALLRARYTDNHSKVQGALRNLRRLEEERRNVLSETEQTIDTGQLWDIASSAPINEETGAQPLLISQLQNLQTARSKVDALQEEIASLKRMITELVEQTAGFGALERQLARLERDLKVKRKLYEDLLQRYEMARVTGSLGLFEQEKRVKVIDRPFTPTAPTNLPLVLFVVAGFIGGIFLGGGLALVLELTDSTVRRRDRLEALAGVPVLSRIPPLASAA
ncbi:MAG: chain-length determining protein [Gammaproteobacteria bacterium]|nr:chain-length determining protein [Gammaproteobacteria bacterium]